MPIARSIRAIKIVIGYGGTTSATNGAKMVPILATKLHKPATVPVNKVGNN